MCLGMLPQTVSYWWSVLLLHSCIDFLFLFSLTFSLQIEIKSSDGNEIHGAYEELYVHITAETFEKVDAAVSVIELLITSVSVSFIIF